VSIGPEPDMLAKSMAAAHIVEDRGILRMILQFVELNNRRLKIEVQMICTRQME
jgi:hypothetical protein